jgi:hypothetical protein
MVLWLSTRGWSIDECLHRGIHVQVPVHEMYAAVLVGYVDEGGFASTE